MVAIGYNGIRLLCVAQSDGDSCMLPRELELHLSEQSLLTGGIVKSAEIALTMKQTINSTLTFKRRYD